MTKLHVRPNFMDKHIMRWNSAEVAEFIFLKTGDRPSTNTVRLWRHRGKIQSGQFGNYRYKRDSVEQFAAAHV